MKKKYSAFGGLNILPIIISLLIALFISQNHFRLWVAYDALIIPVYLLTINFLIDCKGLYLWKLSIVVFVEVICIVIHMAYFRFDFSATSFVIWAIMTGTALAIIAIGGLALCLISKKLRKAKLQNEK